MSVSSQAQSQPEQSQAMNELHPEACFAIAQKIEQLTEVQFTGSLNCDAMHMARLRLFFVAGRLVWAGGGMHRLRRWRRLLKQVCPEAIFALADLTPEFPTPDWEYEALRGLLIEEHISRDQARSLITLQISEVLFDIIQSWSLATRYEAQADDQLKIKDAILLIPAQDLMPEAQAQWEQWIELGMKLYSPNLSPLLEDPVQLQAQVTSGTFTKLRQMLRGQHSLRELASLMGQEVSKLAQALVTYEQQRLLQMRITTDTSGSIPTPRGRSPELAELDALGQSPTSPGISRSNKPRQAPSSNISEPAIASKSTAAPWSPSRRGNASRYQADNSDNHSPLIICIDDQQLVRERIGLILTQQGYNYRGIEDPVQALETIVELRPALVFIDLVMPNMGGYELCNQIRRVESLQNLPLVILTNNDTVFDRMRGKLAGATAYLTKPIVPDEILTTVSQQLAAKAS